MRVCLVHDDSDPVPHGSPDGVRWWDDDDRVIEGSGHPQPATSRCAAGCGDHVRPDDMQEMTDTGPAHVLCLMDGDDDDV